MLAETERLASRAPQPDGSSPVVIYLIWNVGGWPSLRVRFAAGTTKGYGESDPLESGESAQARAKNRRVEISIVDSVLRLEGVVPPNAAASPR